MFSAISYYRDIDLNEILLKESLFFVKSLSFVFTKKSLLRRAPVHSGTLLAQP